MNSIRFKLSVMMFLEFFIWGAWLPLIFGYLPSLGFTPGQQGWVLNAFALASFVGMFFSNQFADRHFAAEKFLAVSHFIGGVSIMALAWTTSFWPFFLLMLVHCLFYVPTISITNSIAFANLKDPQHDFPRIRLWGTIGWIAASWPFVFILVDWAKVPAFGAVDFTTWLGAALGTPKSGEALDNATTYTFITSGIASLLLAGFSLTLPHTPPRPAKDGDQFALFESLKLLAVPFVLVLFLVTFVDAAVHQCYFLWTNDYLKSVGIPANWVMPVMSVGQIAEIFTLAVLGYCLKSLGWRNTMVIGILGHAIRFAIFAFFPFAVPAVLINVLHGVCYAFFFATVYIFVDEFFPKDARTSAQGLFNFLILGVGPFIANFIWPMVGDYTMMVDAKAQLMQPGVVAVSGLVKNPKAAGELPISYYANDKLVSTKDVKIGADGRFDTEFSDVATGPAKFTFLTERKLMIGNREEPVNLSFEDLKDTIDKDKPQVTQAKQWDFQTLFLVPAATAFIAALALLLFFHPPKTAVPTNVGH